MSWNAAAPIALAGPWIAARSAGDRSERRIIWPWGFGAWLVLARPRAWLALS